MIETIRKNRILKDCKDVREEYRKKQRYYSPENDEKMLKLDIIESLTKANRQKEAESMFYEFAMRNPQYKACRRCWERKAKETQIQRIKQALSKKIGAGNGDKNSNK